MMDKRNGLKRSSWLLAGLMVLSACQGKPASTTTATQPEGTKTTQPGTTPGTQPGTTSGTQPTTTPAATTSAGTEPMDLGNSNQNYSNFALYAENEEWVWFSDRDDQYRLCRMKPDGSGKVSFDPTNVIGKNIVDDSLYFLEGSGEGESGLIYRMDGDGPEVSQVSSTKVNRMGAFLTLNDEIYFANYEDKSRLYRMKLDGSGLTKLSEDQILLINADEGWLFGLMLTGDPQAGDQIREIHKMRPDGTEATLLTKVGDYLFLADRGWLYYKGDSNSLFRMRYDGSENTKVVGTPIRGFTLNGDRLYYIDEASNRMMMSSPDGTGSKELIDFPSSIVQFAGDWGYFLDQTGRMYRMDRSGGNIENVTKLPMVEPDPPGTPVVEGLGVINANLKGESKFVRDDDGLYFARFGGGILRMNPDGSDQSTIFDHWVTRLNLVGDWLYFIDMDAYRSIARVRTDGTGYGVVCEGTMSELIVRDNWIYFTDNQKGIIGKVKTDGTELTTLSQTNAIQLNLDGDWLYWSKPSESPFSRDGEGIYQTKIDGSEEVKLTEEPIGSLTVADGWVFYGQGMDRGSVMRMKTDGSEKQTVIGQDAITLVGVYDDRLYYFDGMEEAGLFRSKLDGSEKKRLVGPGNYVWVHFFEDQIIYYDNGREKFRMMDLDGSDIRDFKTPISQ